MIISHKYKFIFIKTAKTAGTSIEVFLSQCCGEDDVVTPIWPHVVPHRARNYKGISNPLPDLIRSRGRDPKALLGDALKGFRFYGHMHATTVRRRVSEEVWDTYFKFCVERNPWDKTLSQYHMVNDWAGGAITFDEYIRRGEKRGFVLNYPKYTDTNEVVLVDRVLKYESLMDELNEVFNKLAVPFEGTLGVRAKSDYRKDRRPYQEVYTTEQRLIIEKAFAKEIEMHSYVF